jgi:hypothetical protein
VGLSATQIHAHHTFFTRSGGILVLRVLRKERSGRNAISAVELATIVTKERRPYMAYLLRVWQVQGKEGSSWRASVEEVHTGERRGFASLEELFDFVREQTGQVTNRRIKR